MLQTLYLMFPIIRSHYKRVNVPIIQLTSLPNVPLHTSRPDVYLRVALCTRNEVNGEATRDTPTTPRSLKELSEKEGRRNVCRKALQQFLQHDRSTEGISFGKLTVGWRRKNLFQRKIISMLPSKHWGYFFFYLLACSRLLRSHADIAVGC